LRSLSWLDPSTHRQRASVLKFREVWLGQNFGRTYTDLWRNLRRTSASWLHSLSLLDPSTQRQRAGKLMIDMTFLVPWSLGLGIASQRLSRELLRNCQSSCWAAAVPAAAVTAAVAAGSGGSLMAFCFIPLCRWDCMPLQESQSNLVSHHVAQARVEAVSSARISIIRGRTKGPELTWPRAASLKLWHKFHKRSGLVSSGLKLHNTTKGMQTNNRYNISWALDH
jgi:hypothetical protein